MTMPSERTRAYVYAILVAAVPLAIAYGILTAEQAALWLGLAGAVLGLGLATANTSTKRDQRGHVDLSVAILVGVLALVVLALLGYFR